jgi:protein-S-isoprenylcysteine O-methyltransferase Ste14
MDEPKKGLNRSGYKRMVLLCFFYLLQTAIFFIAAGRLNLPRAWLFYGLNLGFVIVNMVIGSKLFPELVNVRGEIKKKDTKSWDIVFAIIYTLMLFVSPAIAGLDVGRYLWSDVTIYWVIPGVSLFFVSVIFVDWAMMTNTYFDTAVRIQKDRGHSVVATGPYKIIRHPGYVGMILLYISSPLIIGSLFAWIPAAIIIVSFFIRTALEDKTLRNELEGYLDYSKKVKYRLIPGVW